MAGDKILRCDCGYRVRAGTWEHQVADVRAHAWKAHGISFSADDALAVLRRLELELARSESGDPAIVEPTTRQGGTK